MEGVKHMGVLGNVLVPPVLHQETGGKWVAEEGGKGACNRRSTIDPRFPGTR